MNKKSLSFVLALVMVVTMLPMSAMAASADKFTDVPKDKWYYKFVDFVTDKGYFAGTSKTTFAPDATMTRGMFVTVLANLDGAKVDNTKTEFKDVAIGKWYAGSAKWAVDNNILSGYSDGTFRPDTKISREEMCVIMKKYIDYYCKENNVTHKLNGTDKAFPDASKISSWAKDAVDACHEYGLIEGFAIDGTFRPKNGSTRAEVATVIYKLAWLTKGGSGGSGGGGYIPTPAPTPYQLSVEGTVAIDSGNRKIEQPLNTIVEYTMNESVYDVIDKAIDENKEVITKGIQKAIDKATEEGFIADDGTVKNIRVYLPSEQIINTPEMRNDVVATIQKDEGLKNEIKESLGVEDTEIDSKIAETVTTVLDALTDSSKELDYEKPAQKVVVETLYNKLADEEPVDLLGKIEKNPTYSQYLPMLGPVEEREDKIKKVQLDYLSQLKEMLDEFDKDQGKDNGEKPTPLFYTSGEEEPVSDEIEFIELNKPDENTIMLPFDIDPVAFAKEQYKDKSEEVYKYVVPSDDVNEWLKSINPGNWLDGRKILGADEYFDLMKEQEESIYNLSKTWKPKSGKLKDVVIEEKIAKAMAKAEQLPEEAQLSKEQWDTLQAVTLAFFGDEAEKGGQGLDMSMEDFFTKVLDKKGFDPNKTAKENDEPLGGFAITDKTVTVDYLDYLPTSTKDDDVIKLIKEKYPNAKVTGSVTIDWDFTGK